MFSEQSLFTRYRQTSLTDSDVMRWPLQTALNMMAVWQNSFYNMEDPQKDSNSHYDSPHDEELNLKELDVELKQQKQHQVEYFYLQRETLYTNSGTDGVHLCDCLDGYHLCSGSHNCDCQGSI